MGTRSLTLFQKRTSSGDIVKYVLIYTQFDGYPSGIGMEIVRFILSKQIVNGHTNQSNQANGFGCLVAQYIETFKKGVGNMYILPITSELFTEEYNYIITYDESDSSFTIKVNKDDEIPIDEFEKRYILESGDCSDSSEDSTDYGKSEWERTQHMFPNANFTVSLVDGLDTVVSHQSMITIINKRYEDGEEEQFCVHGPKLTNKYIIKELIKQGLRSDYDTDCDHCYLEVFKKRGGDADENVYEIFFGS